MISLRKMYTNMKKVVRKEVADEKIEIFKTGGGSSCTKVYNPLREITLETMNQKTVTGLNNKFDSDNISTAADMDIGNSSVENPTVSDELETIYIIGETDTAPNETWRKWKPDNLRTPLSNPLKRKAAEDVSNSNSSRRRPAATTVLNSSNISKLYSDLAEQRLECVVLEKNIVKNKEKWAKEKYKMKKEMLEVELQMKLEQLKKINPVWVDNFRKTIVD